MTNYERRHYRLIGGELHQQSNSYVGPLEIPGYKYLTTVRYSNIIMDFMMHNKIANCATLFELTNELADLYPGRNNMNVLVVKEN